MGGRVVRVRCAEEGLHIRYSDSKEQERAESGILSLIALVRDDYTLLPGRKQIRWISIEKGMSFCSETPRINCGETDSAAGIRCEYVHSRTVLWEKLKVSLLKRSLHAERWSSKKPMI